MIMDHKTEVFQVFNALSLSHDFKNQYCFFVKSKIKQIRWNVDRFESIFNSGNSLE
jgi:hypothetical protein